MSEITIILLMAAITYTFRFVPLLFIKSTKDLPKWVEKWFEYIPPAILTVVTVQAAISAVEGAAGPTNLTYLAYGVCGLVALKTKSIVKSLACGMVSLIFINILF